MLIEMEERRFHAPDGPWRRKGWTVEERRLIESVERFHFGAVADLAALLPPGLPERSTTADLAARLGRPRRAAQQMAYCLRRVDVIVAVGKRGHAVEYCVARRREATRTWVMGPDCSRSTDPDRRTDRVAAVLGRVDGPDRERVVPRLVLDVGHSPGDRLVVGAIDVEAVPAHRDVVGGLAPCDLRLAGADGRDPRPGGLPGRILSALVVAATSTVGPAYSPRRRWPQPCTCTSSQA